MTSSDVARIGSVSVSPDSKWVAFSKQDRTLRSHVYIAPIAGGEERHVSDDSTLYSESNAVWTADGQYLIFTSAEGFSNGIATQGGINTTMALWALSLRDQDRDPSNRDIDNEAQGLAAEAAARQTAGRGNAQPVDVRIDWTGMARRARQLTVPGTTHDQSHGRARGSLDRAHRGDAGRRGRTRRRGRRTAVRHLHRQCRERSAHAHAVGPADTGRGRGGRAVAAAGIRRRRDRVREGRPHALLPFRHGTVRGGRAAERAGRRGGRRGTWRRARCGAGGATATEPAASSTARQVTYTANLEVDRKALRSQVFNEGWRIMKNRFYDAKMHGADWNAARKMYEPLLEHLVDTEELQSVMMMMIGHLNASHTGVSGGGPANTRQVQTRYPGFDLVADPSGYYKVGHIYKDGPADRDHLKIATGNFVIAVDDHELKTTENYWQYLTLAAGNKFHFRLNDKPAREGAWDVTIEPVVGHRLGRSAVRALGERAA